LIVRLAVATLRRTKAEQPLEEALDAQLVVWVDMNASSPA
jgi:hypothetical protein